MGAPDLEWLNPRSKEEWLGMRKGRMTSSVVAGAIGVNPHQTPLEAWCAITGRDPFQGNKATVRGTLLELPVMDYPTREGRVERRPAPFVRHGNGWSADSSDCLYSTQDGVLYVGEGKTAAQGVAAEWGQEGTDDIPEPVIVQSCWHMGHWPETRGTIVPVLIGGYVFEFREYSIARDDDLIGSIFEAAERFYVDYVKPDKAPPASAGDDEALRHLWPRHVPEHYIAPTAELEKLTRDYVAAREAEKAALGEKGKLSAQLRQLLGEAEGARGPGWKVTHKYQDGPLVTDWQAIARELGATFEHEAKFTRQTPGWRVLRATLPAEKIKKGKAA